MKKNYLFLIVLLMVSCKKTHYALRQVQMTASVGKYDWVSYQATVSVSKNPALHLTIRADSSTTHFQLDIGNFAGVGTYSLYDSANVATYTAFAQVGGNITHTATSGQIVVTSDSAGTSGGTELKGTFQFLADTVAVRNGTFDVMLYLN